MMKSVVLILFSFFTFTVAYSCSVWIDREEYEKPSLLTENIHKHWYIIKRLEKAINFISQEKNIRKYIVKSVLASDLFLKEFTHEKLIHCLEKINQDGNLVELINLYARFYHFNNVGDMCLQRELVKLTFFLIKEITFLKKQQYEIDMPLTKMNTTEDYLYGIEYFFDILQGKKNNFFGKETSLSPVNLQLIMTNFFIENRISIYCSLFRSLSMDGITHSLLLLQKKNGLTFSKEYVQYFFEKIIKTKHFDFIIFIYQKIMNYSFCHDPIMIKEFLELMLVCLVTKKIADQKNYPNHLNLLSDFITKIRDCSLIFLLDQIDYIISLNEEKLVNHLNIIVNKKNNLLEEKSKSVWDCCYEFGLNENEFVHLIMKRYYYIQRFMRLFCLDSYLFEQTQANNYLSNPTYITKPLFLVWHDFILFRSLQDQVFIENFTKDIFVIVKEEKVPISKKYLHTLALPIRMSLEKKTICFEKYSSISEFEHSLSINEVSNYFYLTERLRYVHKVLKILVEKKIYKNNSTNYSHSMINSYLLQMKKNKTYKPLIILLDKLFEYQFIHDELFMHELVHLVHAIIKDVFSFMCQKEEKIENSLSQIDYIKSNKKLNEQLDEIYFFSTVVFRKINNDADNKKHFQFLSSTLKKYWYVPPIFFCFYSIFLINKQQQQLEY